MFRKLLSSVSSKMDSYEETRHEKHLVQAQLIPPSAIVELFTSQGCSSCPPADRLMIKLLNEDPSLIILSYHVDYWDYLGWKDPHSNHKYTNRQREYSYALNDSRVYTPEAIINGKVGMVGSSESQIRRTLNDSRDNFPLHISVDINPDDSDIFLRVAANSKLSNSSWFQRGDFADVMAIRFLREISVTRVLRGENGGSTLKNVNVVTDINKIGSWNPSKETEYSEYHMKIPADVESGKESIVIIVQTAHCGPILAAIKIF